MHNGRKLDVEHFPITTREDWLALRRNYLTASVIGVLFGEDVEHPYRTLYSVFAEKRGALVLDETAPDEPDDMLERGLELEEVVGRLFQKRHRNWIITKATEFLGCRAPVRLGATPDFYLIDPRGRHGVLQTKVVASSQFRRAWTDDVSPQWINLQCLTEAMLADAAFGMIAALEIGEFKFRLHEYAVPRHAAAERRIVEAAVSFWMSVDGGGQPPLPDYRRDSAIIAAMYPKEEPGKTLDWQMDNEMPALLDRHAQLTAEIKQRTDEMGEIKGRITERMADAERALVPGFSVTNKTVRRKAYPVKESVKRQLRIYKHDDQTEE